MGFEDAYQIAACLASWGDDDPVKALREYETSRVPRVNRVQELANTLGGVPACEAMRRAKEAREWVFGGFAGYTTS
jgi:2-polyprenyl-6-methoxyphenol hydroxylase-like FAD-dependent oxidoreductase